MRMGASPTFCSLPLVGPTRGRVGEGVTDDVEGQ